jgi:hypothetical protein
MACRLPKEAAETCEMPNCILPFPSSRWRADGAKLGQGGVEDAQVEIVSGVYPDEDEEGEVRADNPVVAGSWGS